MRKLMRRMSAGSAWKWLTLAGSSTMLATAIATLVPAKARADSYICNCGGTYCYQTGGSYYQKWCCNGSTCGCSFYVVC